jgi:serine/threonine-protein kinase HipA
VARQIGVSASNTFGLLEGVGGDVAGAIQLLPEGVNSSNIPVEGQPVPLDDEELLRLIDELPFRPMFVGENGLRLSLAGAQVKAVVVMVEGRVAKPCPGQPTTHILKPAVSRFAGLVENEGFCMRLAKAVGLRVARVEPRALQVEGKEPRKFLLVERHDRAQADGRVVRLHQEDFCQSLGLPVEKKYQAEGGPGFKECFDLVDNHSTEPALDRIQLLDALIFNVMVGNSDAHGKNFSFLHSMVGQRGLRLAPLYDVVSTVPYSGEIDQRFAMKVGRARVLEEITPREWDRMIEHTGVARPYLKKRVYALAEAVAASVAPVTAELAELDQAFLRELAEKAVQRAQICVRSLPS